MYLILFFIIWVLFFFISYYTVYYELGNLGTCLIIINFILYWYFGIKIIYMITIPESYRPILVLLTPVRYKKFSLNSKKINQHRRINIS